MIDKGAILSKDRKHRYTLWRVWDFTRPYVVFIGLNPSTANEKEDDPTIRRCVRFASDWGFGGLHMVNLFSIRATDPKEMLKHTDPVGADNDKYIKNLTSNAGAIVCSWGLLGGHQQRDKQIITMLSEYKLQCFGTTKNGSPRHPLYIKASKKLEPLI